MVLISLNLWQSFKATDKLLFMSLLNQTFAFPMILESSFVPVWLRHWPSGHSWSQASRSPPWEGRVALVTGSSCVVGIFQPRSHGKGPRERGWGFLTSLQFHWQNFVTRFTAFQFNTVVVNRRKRKEINQNRAKNFFKDSQITWDK